MSGLHANWERVSLVERIDIDTKQVLPSESPETQFNYIALENVESGTGRLVNLQSVQGATILSGKFRFDSSHVLFGKLRPYLNKVVLPDKEGICSTDILPLRPKEDSLSREWLALCLRSPQFIEYSRTKMDGAKMPRIRTPDLKSYKIPIPPIDEQRRIVARIEELSRRAEEARKLRQEAVAQIATQFFHIRRNIYQSLLSDFPVKPLGKCGKVMGGGTPSKKRDDYWHGDIPWVAPKEMKTFRITASSEQITETAISESSAKLIPAGSVFFVVRGMILARYVPVAVSEVPCAINQDMKAIVPAKGIAADYLAHMLWGANDILQGMVETAGHGTKKLETPAWSNLTYQY